MGSPNTGQYNTSLLCAGRVRYRLEIQSRANSAARKNLETKTEPILDNGQLKLSRWSYHYRPRTTHMESE